MYGTGILRSMFPLTALIVPALAVSLHGPPQTVVAAPAAQPAVVLQADTQMVAAARLAAVRRLAAHHQWHVLHLTHERDLAAQAAAAAAAPAATAQAAQPQASQSAPASAADPAAQSGSYAVGSSFQACVIARESGGNASAVNPASGAGGLYQFLPSTWQALGFSGLPEYASVATQNAAFAEAYALWGASPWAAYDGC